MEDRLTELETKVTYQDQIIEDLNNLVTEQQQQIDKLMSQFEKLRGQMSATEGSNIVDASLEVPPPHY